MKIKIRWLLLFFLVYGLTLIALTPVRRLQPYIDTRLAAYNLNLTQVEGNVWRGSGQLNWANQTTLELAWQVQPLALFLARLPINLQLNNADFDIAGTLIVSLGGLSVNDLSGYVDEQVFRPLTQPYNVNLQGRLTLTDIDLSLNWGPELGAATGDLSWSGGPLSLSVGTKDFTYSVPQLEGQLTEGEQGWYLSVLNMDKVTMIENKFTNEGILEISVQRSLAEQMNLPVFGSSPVVFEMTQQVF